MKVSNAELLRFLNSKSSPEEKTKVEAWMAEDGTHAQELIVLQDAWRHLDNLGDFKMPYTESAWQSVKSKALSNELIRTDLVKEEAQISRQDHSKVATVQPKSVSTTTPKPVEQSTIRRTPAATTTNSGPDLRWLYGILGLLLLALVIWAILHFTRGTSKYDEITAGNQEQIIALDDGSTVYLQPYGVLRYPINMEAQPQRRMTLDGAAKFDVVDNPRPFIVEYGDLSVRTLATIFDVRADADAILAECIDGRIRFFETKNTENGVEIEEGETFSYLGGVFENVTPPKEIVEGEESTEGELIRLDALLDLLMEKSDWKVTSSPSMPFQPTHEVIIDPEADYENLLRDLETKLNFTFEQVSCQGCYVIKQMTARE